MLVGAVVAALSLGGYSNALAAPGQQGGAATDFSSSFEAGDPAPTWTDTVETDPSGQPKASGVNGNDAVSIPGDVTDKVVQVTASAENTPGGEVKENLVDGNVNTKWLVFANTGWAQFKLSEPVAIARYALSSANDAPERDPKNWTIKGSADGQNWTTLDTQTGQTFDSRQQTKKYEVPNTTAYLYYRLDITLNNGGPILQLADVHLITNAVIPPAPNMRTFTDKGPTGGYNTKSNVGFTGVRAFRYLGTHYAKGHGYSYNKVFDVNLAVTKDTQLSYLIFPEFVQGDLSYPSTYAAVDLAFDDGTYLSQLGARDQHGFELSPQGQGASKSLYTNQWNHLTATIGAVAAGKTIKRILLAYDNPNGPATFGGWVDDIKVTGTPAAANRQHLTEYVSTTRGTNSSSSFSRGNNFPATALPHGFNFWSPMTNASSNSWLYEYAKANNADNLPTLQSFTASHEPSPWMNDRQTFQVMPTGGTPTTDRGARALPFRHDNETAQPDYYGVRFENGMRTEITPTDHAAVFRFTFTGDSSSLVFDNVNNNGGLTLDPATGVATGYFDTLDKGQPVNGSTRLFVYATVDSPVKAAGTLTGGGRDNVTGYFQFDTSANKVVTMRIATSLIGVEQAKKNLAQEIAPTDTFDSVRARAQQAWDAALRVIEVQGASEDQLVTLYSNLYRLFLYPNSGFENTGTAAAPTYRYASPVSAPTGANTPTQTGAKIVDGKVYVNNGFWDTYRTTWPAYSLLTPSKAGEMIDGFVQQYKDGGWVSRWSSPGYANLMTGTSSDVAFADAYVKGVGNFDVQAAYDAAIKNATVTPPNQSVGRKGLDTSLFLGYTSTATGEGMSWAMEGYVNDFGIANLAKALYERSKPGDPRRKEYQDNAEYFLNRAQNYVNMFDKNVGFFQGRTPDGAWRQSPQQFDPRVWGNDYTETDAWNMAFSVPQDGQGLANLYGGKDKLGKKLDEFFGTQETALYPGSYGTTIHEMIEARDVRMGQYGHSNQPSHHIAYMYDYAGQPWKTQEKVREALSRLYLGSEIGQGYPGDEDNGEMSAWQIFSSLGFYPLQMGSGNYAVGSPLFTKATVHLENGKDLVINAPKNNQRNVYVQGLKVNGQTYDKTYLPHDVLAKGGVLDFDMGPNPSRWGTAADDAPPSITQGTGIAQPQRDITGAGKGTATGPTDVTALFDNSSQTQVDFAGATPWVQYQPSGAKEKVGFYTLTSGKGAGDPKSWALKGSYDGKTWSVIDQRSGEVFASRQQTRAFKVDKPGRYAYYRLEVTANTGEATTSLAELELLAKPNPSCTSTITGQHNGPLRVSSGVVCLDNATVNGPIVVDAGASLYAVGGSVHGPVSATGAGTVVLLGTKVDGPVTVTGATGEVSIENARISGPVSLVNNAVPAASIVAASAIDGPLACTGNAQQPVNNGLPNTVRGPATGQCQGL
ncbi:glycoside hydrolase family 92 protein [Solihabitans fulvus]|uniref:Glycoside hydrolase family 92 protein n=1 Tax=Solihabitans fulvus TaxID=1892852 RepID=A0A5B2X966_9PSEU|nr:GH92 family glycosyl hydrolase [Solihabitans fulvus]KAA2259412.1 glycoside hydrolase family 92 protein [Solihabitans fulvus]